MRVSPVEEPVLPVESNLSVSCKHCCFQLQVMKNVDFTGNADTAVFLTMLNMDILSLLCKKKKMQTIICLWLILFCGVVIYKTYANILNQIQNNCKRIIMVSFGRYVSCLSWWWCFNLVVYKCFFSLHSFSSLCFTLQPLSFPSGHYCKKRNYSRWLVWKKKRFQLTN